MSGFRAPAAGAFPSPVCASEGGFVSTHFADQLVEAIQAKGAPVCVGIDPIYDRLPADIAEQKDMNDATDSASAISRNRRR